MIYFTDSCIFLSLDLTWSFDVFTAISTFLAPVLTLHIMFFSQEPIRGLREVFVFDVVQYFRLIYLGLNCGLLLNYLSLTMHMCHHAAMICAVSKQPSHSLFLQSIFSFSLRPRGFIRTSVFPSANTWHTSNARISLTPHMKEAALGPAHSNNRQKKKDQSM